MFWEHIAHLTRLILRASAKYFAPSSPILFICSTSVVRVWINDGGDSVFWAPIDDLTRLIFSASARDIAPSASIPITIRLILVSVYTKRWKCWCDTWADWSSHSINFERVSEKSRSFMTHSVVFYIQSSKCLHTIMETVMCYESGWSISPDWLWAYRRPSVLLLHLLHWFVYQSEEVSTQSYWDGSLLSKPARSLTWLVLSASAIQLTPSSPIWLAPSSRLVSV